MELKDILAISGQPGLFKYVARSNNGVIVESLSDGKRMNASGTAKISALAEISIYTDSEDMPLWKVFEAFFTHTGGKTTISHKADPSELKKVFGEVIPDYDRDRVHVSDIKKVISWFNMLIEAGMTEFKVEEETEESEQQTEKPAKEAAPAKPKPASQAQTKAAPKNQASAKAPKAPAKTAGKGKAGVKK